MTESNHTGAAKFLTKAEESLDEHKMSGTARAAVYCAMSFIFVAKDISIHLRELAAQAKEANRIGRWNAG